MSFQSMLYTSSFRQNLRNLLERRSIRRGSFKLASGLQSDIYIDGKLTTCSAEGTRLVGLAFIDLMARNGWKPAAVGGLVIGADPIVISIARESLESSSPIDAFLIRKEPKKHGLQKFIEGIEYEPGLPVVIVDDVCTTGGSTKDAIDKARDAGMKVLGALCLVDRQMGAEQTMRELDCPFDSVFKLSELLDREEQSAVEPAEATFA